jgi:hypothetical protein
MAVLFGGGLYALQGTGVTTTAAWRSVGAGPMSGTEQAQAMMRFLAEQWQTIPLDLRQRMLVLAGGIAIIAFAVAVAFPKQTTWVFTAGGGAGMVAAGLFAMAHLLRPALLEHLPNAGTLWGIFGVVTVAGMLLQYVCFWPRVKRKGAGTGATPQPVAA